MMIPFVTFFLLSTLVASAAGDNFRPGLRSPPLNAGPTMGDINQTSFRYDSVIPPTTATGYDWRSYPQMTPILSQQKCESCWAIAAVDSIAIMWAILQGTAGRQLSPQQVCDCTTSDCCGGGWPEWAYAYVLANGGIATHDSYPYTAIESPTCGAAATTTGGQITGWETVPPYNSDALKKAVFIQPVVVLISSNSVDFQRYSGGLFAGSCGLDPDHALLVVGYGYDTATSTSYWILKNTWGITWGEGGFMRLPMVSGAGMCGMLMHPPMFPVYFPNTPQPPRFAQNMPVTFNISVQSQYNGGEWWNSGTWSNLWSLFFTYVYSPCTGNINPCGTGTCTSQYGIIRCACPSGFVERLGVPTSKCVAANPCSALFNPCGSGQCSATYDGSYTCSCSSGFVMGSRADGGLTCVAGGRLGGYRTYSTMYGDTCQSVATAFGLTTSSLKSWNPFLDCSSTSGYLPQGILLAVSSSTVGSGCSRTYPVGYSTTLNTLLSVSGLSQSGLQAANPNVDLTNLYPSQSICIQTASVSSQGTSCTKANTTGKSDTCASFASATGVGSISALQSLNPGLNCAFQSTLPYGIQLCVSNAAITLNTCNQWKTVLFGESCFKIYTAANLTLDAFLNMNPGLQCQSPYLQVGTSVCLSSPSVSPGSGLTYLPTVITPGSSLQTIATSFAGQCQSYPTAANICSYNNFTGCPSPKLVVGAVIYVPCVRLIGTNNCYCSPSTYQCGTDFNFYPSYCDANCNYASPSVSGQCQDCQTACAARTGLNPNTASRPGATPANCNMYWNSYLDSGVLKYACKYPTWTPTDSDWMINPAWPLVPRNCAFYNKGCKLTCDGTFPSTKYGSSWWTCYNTCYSTTVTGCGNTFDFASYPGTAPCTSSTITYCNSL